jgi:DM4/DM12 family
LGPIDTEKYINCNAIRNFHFQFDTLPNITTILSKVPARQRSIDGGKEAFFKADSTRKIAYEIVEDILSRENKNGHECMLRTICEVAETPVNHNGLIGELMQLFFTPGRHEKLHEDYQHARKAGLNRVNCEKLYPDCPFGHGILDSVSLVEEFKFKDWLNF